MRQTYQPDILQKIENAVIPLTGTREFRLDTVAYGTKNSEVVVKLYSNDKITIFFDGKNVTKYPDIHCSFFIHSTKKFFRSKYLFSAMNIPISLSSKNPAWDIERSYFLTNKWKHNAITELEVIDFYEDLERWCSEININWNKIRNLFAPENLASTIDFYSVESRKHEKNQEVFQSLYPVSDYEPRKPNHFRGSLPGIVEIMVATKPLDFLCNKSTITCHVGSCLINITYYLIANDWCRLLFNSDENGSVNVYFVLSPWLNLQRETLSHTEKRQIIFALENVFRCLNIEFSDSPKGPINDLQEFSRILSNNSELIAAAFSYENLQGTYNLLKRTKGNNEDKINRVLESE